MAARTRRGGSKSGSFLIEMLIVILFFAIVSALCLRLFGAARLRSIAGQDLGQAVSESQTAAECLKAAQGDSQRLAELLNASAQGDVITCYYDSGWKPSAQEQERRMVISLEKEAAITSANIAVYKGDQEIYTLTVQDYQPED